MKINYQKSALMIFEFKKMSAKELEELQKSKFPIQDRYKYLGAQISSNLKLDNECVELKKKINWLTMKLTPIRIQNNLKLNINLWKVLCIPSIKLSLLNFNIVGHVQKKRYSQLMRILFNETKFFMK